LLSEPWIESGYRLKLPKIVLHFFDRTSPAVKAGSGLENQPGLKNV
jgi:hypothetical protein